jgi:hypothetical protein
MRENGGLTKIKKYDLLFCSLNFSGDAFFSTNALLEALYRAQEKS